MMLRAQTSTIKGDFEVEYHDADAFDHLPLVECRQCYGICYFQDQIVLAKSRMGHFTLPGGTIEPGETLSQTLQREVQEESNMRVLRAIPIGYQKVWNDTTAPIFQLRYYAQVEPIGPFESDPAGHFITIKLVDPLKAPQMLDWGEIGNRLFTRAAQLHL